MLWNEGPPTPQKGVRILKSVEFHWFQEIFQDFIDFMGFYKQTPDHPEATITYLYSPLYTTVWQRYVQMFFL